MKKLILSLLLVLLVTAATAVSRVPTASTTADEDAVREVVQHYFDGMMRARPDFLRRAFHADARLIGVGAEGAVMIIPFDQWAASWDGRDPRDVSEYDNKIVSVDVTGTAASVKTDLEWPNVHYVDYLSLLKVGDEWRIVNKIWWQEPR